jgi:hypothetical protein
LPWAGPHLTRYASRFTGDEIRETGDEIRETGDEFRWCSRAEPAESQRGDVPADAFYAVERAFLRKVKKIFIFR